MTAEGPDQPSWPWCELGIEPTVDARSIRRAYAAGLKRRRPEDDPEAFQRWHQAYQDALASCTQPAEQATGHAALITDASVPMESVEPASSPEETLPSRMSEPEENSFIPDLERAVADGPEALAGFLDRITKAPLAVIETVERRLNALVLNPQISTESLGLMVDYLESIGAPLPRQHPAVGKVTLYQAQQQTAATLRGMALGNGSASEHTRRQAAGGLLKGAVLNPWDPLSISIHRQTLAMLDWIERTYVLPAERVLKRPLDYWRRWDHARAPKVVSVAQALVIPMFVLVGICLALMVLRANPAWAVCSYAGLLSLCCFLLFLCETHPDNKRGMQGDGHYLSSGRMNSAETLLVFAPAMLALFARELASGEAELVIGLWFWAVAGLIHGSGRVRALASVMFATSVLSLSSHLATDSPLALFVRILLLVTICGFALFHVLLLMGYRRKVLDVLPAVVMGCFLAAASTGVHLEKNQWAVDVTDSKQASQSGFAVPHTAKCLRAMDGSLRPVYGVIEVPALAGLAKEQSLVDCVVHQHGAR